MPDPPKHTPAPWDFKASGEANQYTVLAVDNWLLHILHNGEAYVSTQEANMHLISAAPTMLYALQDAIQCLTGYGYGRWREACLENAHSESPYHTIAKAIFAAIGEDLKGE